MDAPGPALDFRSQVLSMLAASCADGIYCVDTEQRVIFWSESAERLTGRRCPDVIGRFCYEVMLGVDYEGHPYCRRDCPTVVAARRGRPVQSYDIQVNTPGGRPAWLNMSIISLKGRTPQQTLIVHMFRDVTRRRQAELLAEATLSTVARFADMREKPAYLIQTRPLTQPPLTAREREVLQLLASGAGTNEMAERLGLAGATIRNHVNRLVTKLGVHSRLEAVVTATQLGLLQ